MVGSQWPGMADLGAEPEPVGAIHRHNDRVTIFCHNVRMREEHTLGPRKAEFEVPVLAHDIQNFPPYPSPLVTGTFASGSEGTKPLTLGARVPLSLSKRQDRGRCLISLVEIPSEATIEIAPVQVLPPEIVPLINSIRSNFITWRRPHFPETLAMPLGLLGLCNHSDYPNASVRMDYTKQLVYLLSRQPIAMGDEITINYREPARGYRRPRECKVDIL
jgi:hypothetical protein